MPKAQKVTSTPAKEPSKAAAKQSMCKVVNCGQHKRRRAVFCSKCWDKLPKNLKLSTRDGTEKGTHSLRATPSKSWYEYATKYVGNIRLPRILGAGLNAVKVEDAAHTK